MKFEEQFPSLEGYRLNVIFKKEDLGYDIFSMMDVKRCCLDKEKVKQALTKYSKLNNKIVKSFQSMEEAQQLNNAWNTMIDELGL